MPKPASNVVAAVMSLAVVAAPAVLLSACTPNEPPSSTPGTTPSIWTGAPAPTKTPPRGGPIPPESITTHLRAPDGVQVATATFEFNHGYVTVTVQTTGVGLLSPGFHGLHIHKVGKCEPDSVAPTGGPRGAFLSAGGHYQAPGHTGVPASGDLTSLEVRQDGAALLVTTTDMFTKEDLLAGQKKALIIHGGPDNFANIPAERYTQVNGTPGPDETTMTTGDSGKRVACGVIGAD
ncbi:superoxide dismutase[Cu-Zn] [Mycobacterium botniense]|uniref:Superoxide dismutase [Cu-Zn] n=1 Tax=Mycobacterium botniense TaxID=84962 RepID=A0A7I9XV95_9MYCO|nr:superoxide dismutase family protein [Mycobacterium botniense]GFG73457.1 superoxide dismutase [Cu-Zn] [Mycobacterium botniense]